MLGIYIHIPFCLSKCPYCDFYSLPYREELAQQYVQAAVRAVACGLGGALLFAAFLLLASAALRSAFPVVVGATVLLLLPMFFDFDPTSVPLWPLLLFNLLPGRMMKFENIFSPAPYDLFGAVLPQYVVFPAVALVLCLPLAALALRAYRRHQPA